MDFGGGGMLQIKAVFPSLEGFETTRDTLHWYSKAIGVISRAHAEIQPRWQHLGLIVRPNGFETVKMPLPGGGKFSLRMDLTRHRTVLVNSSGTTQELDMLAGFTAVQFGEQLIQMVKNLGLKGKYDRKRFEDNGTRFYDPEMAERFLAVLNQINRIFNRHRESLEGDRDPVLLWPHGFDLGFVWFGSRPVTYEENGKIVQGLAQLNLGFSPGESSYPKPYFYSNPWPFEKDKLVNQPLPEDASWHLESWKGSLLPYNRLVNKERAEELLLEYARAVYKIAAPTLNVGGSNHLR